MKQELTTHAAQSNTSIFNTLCVFANIRR